MRHGGWRDWLARLQDLTGYFDLQPALAAVEGVGREIQFDLEQAVTDRPIRSFHRAADLIAADFCIEQTKLEIDGAGHRPAAVL
jgi:hypothetical protein